MRNPNTISNLAETPELPQLTGKTTQEVSEHTSEGLQQSFHYADAFGQEFVDRLQSEGNFKPQLGLNMSKLFSDSIKAEERAKYESQSTAVSVFNFVGQTLADIVGGTLEGAGYILDIPAWGSALFGDNSKMGNWLSDF